MNNNALTRSLLLFGDSILSNWYLLLQNNLDNWEVTNKAVSGETTSDLLHRLSTDLVGHSHDAVLIHVGINDIAGNSGEYFQDDTVENLATIVKAAKQSHTHVLLSNLLPVTIIPWRECSNVYHSVLSLNDEIKNLAIREDVDFVDFFACLANDEGFMDKADAKDGVHPNKHSYCKMLSALSNMLENMALDPSGKNRKN
ncbi:SGNH/GDSL hydrolase family protein [Alteromonas sp. KUL49]|uniref:SGNH/GDSL hydrolase family protein n=1 Tax=Alteromonas sp. KUL49 TaxID=2480798 RepID=UPI0010FFB28B|nr:SGNH/GDSL hydrolase family protein [Alteromonas sp. KUL49]GEA12966.1 lipase [Alteromonas sp. KUL49]